MKIEKVYFPRWVAWFVILIFLPILLVVEYESFYGVQASPLIGAVIGLIFIMLIVMSFLVSYRRIPYMIIERQTKSKRERA